LPARLLLWYWVHWPGSSFTDGGGDSSSLAVGAPKMGSLRPRHKMMPAAASKATAAAAQVAAALAALLAHQQLLRQPQQGAADPGLFCGHLCCSCSSARQWAQQKATRHVRHRAKAMVPVASARWCPLPRPALLPQPLRESRRSQRVRKGHERQGFILVGCVSNQGAWRAETARVR
jgi:hypothetical protein